MDNWYFLSGSSSWPARQKVFVTTNESLVMWKCDTIRIPFYELPDMHSCKLFWMLRTKNDQETRFRGRRNWQSFRKSFVSQQSQAIEQNRSISLHWRCFFFAKFWYHQWNSILTIPRIRHMKLYCVLFLVVALSQHYFDVKYSLNFVWKSNTACYWRWLLVIRFSIQEISVRGLHSHILRENLVKNMKWEDFYTYWQSIIFHASSKFMKNLETLCFSSAKACPHMSNINIYTIG